MKRLLSVCIVMLIAAALFASGSKEKPGAAAPAASASVGGAKEAPQVAKLVADKKLPPLNERLPKKPLVVKPVERIGQYGGDWRVAQVGGNLSHVARYQGYEQLVRWTPGWGGIEANVAESYEVNADATEYSFKLREGMKWSDGAPFGVDDILFWYEDIFLNDKLTPAKPNMFKAGGKNVVVEKLGPNAVKFKFAAPNGLFLQQMAAMNLLIQFPPKHYFGKFHVKYNPDADKLAKQSGYADWSAMFIAKGGTGDSDSYWQNSEMPVIYAWKFSVAPGQGSASRAIAERNPYYWKVDTEGNQLPYIDRVVYDLLQDVEVLMLKVLNGEIDMMDQYFALPSNKTVIYDNQKKGGYRLFTTTPTLTNAAVVQFNLNHPNPAMRKFFQNKDFRVAVSHAINRKEIINLVYLGQGEPAQAAPRPGTPFYQERLAKQYLEFNPKLAGEMLDKLGLDKKDAAGFRLDADGKRFTFTFEIDAGRTEFVDMAQLLQGYFKAVGLDAQIKTMDRSLWEVRVRQNAEYDATIHRFGGGAGQAVLLDPRYYFPFNSNSLYAPAWQTWYTNPSGKGSKYKPEEPPAPIRQQMKLYDEVRATGDLDKQLKLIQQILDIAADQFYCIGITLEADGYGVVKNNFRNVPASLPWSWDYPHPAPENPCQFFIDKSVK